MDWRQALKVVFLCALVVCVIAAIADPALAAAAPAPKKGGDQSLAEKKGMEGLFANNKFAKDDPRKPTKTQKYLGLGSIAVMIIVVKYL
ncbi:MAG: hypothetical protein K1Y02_17300 [Candidatus Hydrogenedentes bacterium]|nr:hypothetical protein [Candidatus Hydrogenedentota bacterium]